SAASPRRLPGCRPPSPPPDWSGRTWSGTGCRPPAAVRCAPPTAGRTRTGRPHRPRPAPAGRAVRRSPPDHRGAAAQCSLASLTGHLYRVPHGQVPGAVLRYRHRPVLVLVVSGHLFTGHGLRVDHPVGRLPRHHIPEPLTCTGLHERGVVPLL